MEFVDITDKTINITHNRRYESSDAISSFLYKLTNYERTDVPGKDSFLLRIQNLDRDNISLATCKRASKCTYTTIMPTVKLSEYAEFRVDYPDTSAGEQEDFSYTFTIEQNQHFSLIVLRNGYLEQLQQDSRRFYMPPNTTRLFSYSDQASATVIFELMVLTGDVMMAGGANYSALLDDVLMVPSTYREVSVVSNTRKFYLKVATGNQGSLFTLRARGNIADHSVQKASQ
jgi:hypothetical protein